MTGAVKLALVGAVVLLVGVGLLLIFLPARMADVEIDRCLDHGGCWDYDTGQCASEQRRCDDARPSREHAF